MTKELKGLLLMNATSTIIFNYIGIFVNLYIWQKEKSIFDITWFNLILFSIWGFAFILGAKLLTKYSIRLLMRISACSGGTTFLLLTFFKLDNRLLWITIIALPVGVMWGIFSSAQNLSLSLSGKGKQFQHFFSLSNIIGQLISIINPIVFAFIIKYIGYNQSFWIILTFIVVMIIVSFNIPKISLANQYPNEDSKLLFQSISWKCVFNTRELKWLIPSCLVAGMFLQFQGLFALIYTFSVSQDKMVIAILNVLYTLSAIFAMILYKKSSFRDSIWLKIGMGCISIGFLIVIYPAPLILIISNILTTIGMYYFGTVWNGQQFQMIHSCSPIHKAKILMWRENLLCLSRTFMLLLILPLQKIHGITFVILISIALVCSILVPIFQKKLFLDSMHTSEHHTF